MHIKKILLSLIVAFILPFGSVNAQTIHTYAENSVLSQGKWAKIKVSETGIYKLTYDEIRNMGFSNPANIRIFGFGGAMLDENFLNPKIDDLPEIAVYDGGNYVLFYAQGAIKWNSNLNSLNCKFTFTINPYSDFGYYFLTTDAGKGKRIGKETVESADYPLEVTDFIDYTCVKKEEINFARSGRVWYGDVLTSGGTKRYNFTFPNIETEKEMRVQISAAAASGAATEMSVSVDNLQEKLSFLSVAGHVKAHAREVNLRKYPSSDQISINLFYSGRDASDRAALDRITINVWRKLVMVGNSLFFRNDECIGYYTYSRFTLQNASPNTLIWNITDPQNITEVPTTFSDKLQFVKKTDRLLEFAAVNPSGQFPTPEFVGLVTNQNLHALPVTTDFVIISYPGFLSEANRLAQKHRDFEQMNVAVVTPEQIYNEFSSGTPDATAYRWLMKMLYDRDEAKNPKYLLLFGDGSYDNKGILATKATPAYNFILTFQSYNSIDDEKSYVTDDYFGFIEDTDGNPPPPEKNLSRYANTKVNIGIGRFPVSTLNAAKAMVDKSITYMENKRTGAWKNKVCLIADDNEKYTNASTFNRFMANSNEIDTIITRRNPNMEVKKMYFDAFTRVTGSNGNRFPELEALLQEEIKSGIKFLNYIGHSGPTSWAEERVFTQAQARALQNKNLGFWFTASCEFTRFDDLATYSGGEDLFLNPNGGAIAVYSSSRIVFDNYNQQLNRALARVLFLRDEEGKPLRFGDIYKKSKQVVPNDSNKLSFVLLANPALRFAYPDLLVKTDSIVFLSNNERTDTIRAHSVVRVFGRVEDYFGSEISNFSGKMKVKVFDKEISLFTKTHKFEYKARPNVLFSGETTVENGQFSFVFKVPKDINYSYGSGRINYYAYDDENGFEAQGDYQDFIIGGSDDNAIYDTEGPEVTLYLNTNRFRSGDKVNESPVFFAFVKDESGINTSGGIGHDITLTLNDSKNPIVLNSFFNFFPNSYTEGSLAYPLENLAPGRYTLTFKVWDLLNNSTTKQIEFEVVRGLRMNIEEMIAYPNPAQEYVYFQIRHDRPESVLECKAKVYTLSGQLVYESDGKNFESSNVLTLGWNLRTSSGNRLPGGVYIYRIEMRTSEGKFTGKSQKLIISGQ